MKRFALLAVAIALAGCTKEEANAAKNAAEQDGARIAACIATNVLADTGAQAFSDAVAQVKGACLQNVQAAALDQFMLAISSLVGEHRAGLAATRAGVCR